MHIAYKFEHLLNTHRWPDAHRWTGQQMRAVGRGPGVLFGADQSERRQAVEDMQLCANEEM
jgi:hypothetical protein